MTFITRLRSLLAALRRYPLDVVRVVYPGEQETPPGHVLLTLARRGSGLRGGRERNVRHALVALPDAVQLARAGRLRFRDPCDRAALLAASSTSPTPVAVAGAQA